MSPSTAACCKTDGQLAGTDVDDRGRGPCIGLRHFRCPVHRSLPLLLLYAAGCLGNPDAKRLYDDLLSNYNRLIRPVSNNTDTVLVKLGLRLSQLIELVRAGRRISPLLSSPLPPSSPTHNGIVYIVNVYLQCPVVTVCGSHITPGWVVLAYVDQWPPPRLWVLAAGLTDDVQRRPPEGRVRAVGGIIVHRAVRTTNGHGGGGKRVIFWLKTPCGHVIDNKRFINVTRYRMVYWSKT